MQSFFSKKMFRGTLSLTQENHNCIVQIGKNKNSQWTKFGVCLAGIVTFKNFYFLPLESQNVCVPLRPPRKKALPLCNNQQVYV
jgi:hypothetical protein